jgi:hypothetical protein
MPWISIPDDVIVWFRDAFAEANGTVVETLLNVPNIRETSLDDAFIQALVPRSAPTLLASGAIVRMDIHNIGGLRRTTRWEVADIGMVVFVLRAGTIIARKLDPFAHREGRLSGARVVRPRLCAARERSTRGETCACHASRDMRMTNGRRPATASVRAST